MGQIADDILQGRMCVDCGVCFRKKHGYPVACVHCWSKYAMNDTSRPEKATHTEV